LTNRNTSVASVLAQVRTGVTSLFSRWTRAAENRFGGTLDKLAALRDERSPEMDSVVGVPSAKQSLLLSGTTLTLIGVLLTGFIADLVLVSPLRYAREQIVQSEQIRFSLANGEGPIAQMDADGDLYPLGTPVAIMQIPALNITAVVDEGTTSRVLLAAPGHRRDTPLPGQTGVSVIYGRQSLYGGPFGGLAALDAGNTIRVTTAQGVSLYRITGKRTGDSAIEPVAPVITPTSTATPNPSATPTAKATPKPTAKPTPTATPKSTPTPKASASASATSAPSATDTAGTDATGTDTVAPSTGTAAGRLTLVSTTGFPFFPDQIIRIDADLVSTANPAPLPVIYPASLTSAERLLGTDDSGWLPLLLLLELGLVAVALAVVGIRRWGRIHTWVVAVPVLLAIGIALAETVVIVMPNLY
jgi:hypothetical protein